MGNGGFVDSNSTDRTFSTVHTMLGKKAGLLQATDPVGVLQTHNMLEEPAEDDNAASDRG